MEEQKLDTRFRPGDFAYNTKTKTLGRVVQIPPEPELLEHSGNGAYSFYNCCFFEAVSEKDLTNLESYISFLKDLKKVELKKVEYEVAK